MLCSLDGQARPLPAQGQLTTPVPTGTKMETPGQGEAFRGSGGGRGPGKAPGQDWGALLGRYRRSSKQVSPRGLFLRAAQRAPLRSQYRRAGGGIPPLSSSAGGLAASVSPSSNTLLQLTFQRSTPKEGANDLLHVRTARTGGISQSRQSRNREEGLRPRARACGESPEPPRRGSHRVSANSSFSQVSWG